MTLEDRINRTRADSYEAQRRCQQVVRESSQIHEQCREQLHQWQVATMKHVILIAEIKRSCLLADAGRLARRVDVEHCGLPIQ